MPTLPLALPRQSDPSALPHGGAARLINMYARPREQEGRMQMELHAHAGLSLHATLSGSSGVRAMIELDGSAYVVSGTTVSKVTQAGVETVIGTMASAGSFCGIARNSRAPNAQIALASNGIGRIIENDAVSTISDGDLLDDTGEGPIDVCCIDRYFVFAYASGAMKSSGLDSGTAIDPLDVATAESSPDGLLRVVDRGRDLIAIGDRSIEIWADVANPVGFPFSRQHAISVGAMSAGAVTKATILSQGAVADTVAWAATDQRGTSAGVMMLDGYTPRKISTTAVDRAFRDVSDRETIKAFSWIEGGHAFIGWRLPDTCWIYDTSTGLWSERRSRDAYNGETTWRVGAVIALGNGILAGSATAAKTYWLDPAVYDEDGDDIVTDAVTPPLHSAPGRVQCNAIYLDAQPGVGRLIDNTDAGLLYLGGEQLQLGGVDLALNIAGNTENDAAIDPVVMMSHSRDGGETWSTERSRSLGELGARQKRLKWTLGATSSHTGLTFRFRASAAVARMFTGASWEGGALKP